MTFFIAGDGPISISNRNGYWGSVPSWNRSAARDDAEKESCGRPDERRHLGFVFHRSHGSICSRFAALVLAYVGVELLADPTDPSIAMVSRIDPMVGANREDRQGKSSARIL